MKRDDMAELVFDLLVLAPQGVTLTEMAESSGLTVDQVRTAIQRIREVHGENDSVNVICEPDPATPNGQWLYRLIGNSDDARWWQGNRTRDAERRIRTMLAVARSVARQTSGRTLEGKRARVHVRHLERLLEDLDELTAS